MKQNKGLINERKYRRRARQCRNGKKWGIPANIGGEKKKEGSRSALDCAGSKSQQRNCIRRGDAADPPSGRWCLRPMENEMGAWEEDAGGATFVVYVYEITDHSEPNVAFGHGHQKIFKVGQT